MCLVALLHYSALSHLLCSVAFSLYWMLYLTLQPTTVAFYSITEQYDMLCCSIILALRRVALCSIQDQTQQSFRIILMPRLLPGNSCPGTEMNGCPWALSLSSSPSLPLSFFSSQCLSLTQTVKFSVKAVSCSFLHSADTLSPFRCCVVGFGIQCNLCFTQS